MSEEREVQEVLMGPGPVPMEMMRLFQNAWRRGEQDDANDTSPEMEEYRRKKREREEKKVAFVTFWREEETKAVKRFRSQREGAMKEFDRVNPVPKRPERATEGCNCERCTRIRAE